MREWMKIVEFSGNPPGGGGGGPVVDIEAFDGQSFLEVKGKTEDGVNWLLQYTSEYDPLDDALYVEHRYGPDLLQGAHQAGLVVSLDGRIADAPRDFD